MALWTLALYSSGICAGDPLARWCSVTAAAMEVLPSAASSPRSGRAAVRVDAQQPARRDVGAAHQVEAEIADVGASSRVHHHLIRVPADMAGQVCVHDQLAARLAAQQLAVAH